MQKFKFFKSPFLFAAIICFSIAVALPFSVKDHKEVKGVSQKINPTTSPSATPTDSVNENKVQTTRIQTYITVTSTPANSVQSPSASSGQANSTPVPTQAVKTFQVNLKINGSSVGNIDLTDGSNQCDVLSKAKDQGKLSQLLMKYDDSLGTNGVYQINGQGSENVVWWTYKVNGTAPTQGCSYIKANSGDNVEWEYKGN